MTEAIRELIEKWDEAIAMNEQAYRDLPKPLPIPDDLPNDWRTEPVMAGARAGALEGIRVYTRCKTDLRAALPHAGEVPQLTLYVHHACRPSNLAGAPPFAEWCHHKKRVVDAAGQQDDYECPHCHTKIFVSMPHFKEGALPPVQTERK